MSVMLKAITCSRGMFKDNTNAESSITMQMSIGSYVSLFNRVFFCIKMC